MSRDWREVMGVKKAEPLTVADLAHLDALWAQSCLHDDDENAYLAGIGAMWPTLRPAVFWDITNRAYEASNADEDAGTRAYAEWVCTPLPYRRPRVYDPDSLSERIRQNTTNQHKAKQEEETP